MHEPAAQGDDAERIFKFPNTCQRCGNKLSDAVSRHHCRFDAQALPESRQRILDDKDGRLSIQRVHQ